MRSCPFCQAILQDDARFCNNCGRNLLYGSGPDDTAPTQPVKLNPAPGQPTQPVGQPQPYGLPYGQPPYPEQPSYNNQPAYDPPAYPPPIPTSNQRPTWLLLLAGLSLLILLGCGVTFLTLIFTAQNGAAGLGAQVSTQIAQAFGGAGLDTPAPTETVSTPSPWPTFTPAPTETPPPSPTPQAEASFTPNPTQASLANKLLSPECKAALDQLSKVSDQVKNDPLKVLDDAWRKDMDQATADLKTNCGSLDSASPIPGEIGQVQQSLNQATSEFDQAKLLWNQAIDQHDPGKALSAAQHVGEATKYLSQAISQLQKLVH